MENNHSQITAPAQQASMPVFNIFDPAQFEIMQRYCRMFAYSELVPDMYKAVLKPFPNNATEGQIKAIQAENKMIETKAMSNCMIAISMAIRINADPLMIMQNMAVIHGRPSWSSKFLIATVNTCGRFEPLQYKHTVNGKVGKIKYAEFVWNDRTRRKETILKEFDGSQIDNMTCIAFTTKKGSSDILQSTPVDLRMVIAEGWWTKAGSKWPTMTKQMLIYRAASFWTNSYAPELSMGMRTIEENQDVEDADYVEIKDVDKQVQVEKKKANTETIDMDSAPVENTEQPAEEKKTDDQPKPQPQEQKPAEDGPNW